MMTISEPHILAAARRRRVVPAAVASLLGSVGVHAAFAVAAAGIAWQLSQESPASSRDVVIRFEDPAAAEGDDNATGPIIQPTQSHRTETPKPPRENLAATGGLQPPAVSELPAVIAELPPSMLTAAPRSREHGPETSRPATVATTSQGDTELSAGASGVRFAGLGASNARSVIYVVDASGPMITSMPRVIEELRRSVEQLSPSQKFSVVLFRRTDSAVGAEVFAPVLMRATPSAKARLVEWLAQIRPSGASNPLSGLEAALALKPDAVFLLSRSIVRSGGGVWEDGLEATLARLEELNPPTGPGGRRETLIQTIQFLDDDPTGVMQAIGARHGQGSGYRVVRRGEDIAGRAR